MKIFIKTYIFKILKIFKKREKLAGWKGDFRIFCISFQRTGTTSFGNFFKHFNYPRAGYGISRKNKWTKSWYEEKYEDIFNSKDFELYQVYEDDPWWCPEFYKEVYKRYPESKFILQLRDSKKWFKSMESHSGGKTLGNTRRHVKIYDRVDEFEEKLRSDSNFKPSDNGVDNLMSLYGMERHYIQVYEKHINDVVSFFKNNSPKSLLVVNLDDEKKWQKIGQFMGFEIPADFDIHSNKSYKK